MTFISTYTIRISYTGALLGSKQMIFSLSGSLISNYAFFTCMTNSGDPKREISLIFRYISVYFILFIGILP